MSKHQGPPKHLKPQRVKGTLKTGVMAAKKKRINAALERLKDFDR